MKTKLLQSLCFGILVWFTWAAKATVLTEAQKPSAEAFRSMRYGLFSHVVYSLTISPDAGRSYKSLDEFADGFDVKAYADQVKSMGVEYVFFTAWHRAMYNLGPNAALEKWLPGHTAKRDVIAEVAEALNERGIKLIIYAHPNDGHDLKKEEQERVGFIPPKPGVSQLMPKFNDFINEVYA
jgi:alpha-L-fucosidase